MKRADLLILMDINHETLVKLGKNQPVRIKVLIKICDEFFLSIGDIMESMSIQKD